MSCARGGLTGWSRPPDGEVGSLVWQPSGLAQKTPTPARMKKENARRIGLIMPFNLHEARRARVRLGTSRASWRPSRMQLLPKGTVAVRVAWGSVGCAEGDLARWSKRCGAGVSVRPLSRDGAGSTLALAVVGSRRLAFAADEDDARVHAFDLDRRVELAVTPLRGTPAQIAI